MGSTPAGIKTALPIGIPNAEFDVSLMLRKVSEHLKIIKEHEGEGNEELLETLKNSIISILKQSNVREKRDELVSKIFEDGVHNAFQEPNLDNCLMEFSAQLRVMTFSRDSPEKKQRFEDEAYILAFQNPILVMMALVQVCIRTQRCSPLLQVRIFLDLPIGLGNSDDNMPSDTTVLEFILYKSMIGFHETENSWYFYLNGLSGLVERGLMDIPKLMELLKKLYKEFCVLGKNGNMAKIMKLFKTTLKPYLEDWNVEQNSDQFIASKREQELKCNVSFLRNVVGQTYIIDQLREIMEIRDSSLYLLDRIFRAVENSDETATEKDAFSCMIREYLENKPESTLNLGLIYMRFPDMQLYVKELMANGTNDQKWNTLDAYKELTADAITLINSSSRREWKILIEFIIKVMYPHRKILQTDSIFRFMNVTLTMAFKNLSIRITKFLNFYEIYLEIIKTDSGMGFAKNFSMQQEVVQTLGSLICSLFRPKKVAQRPQKVSYIMIQKKTQISLKIVSIFYKLMDWAHKEKVVYPEDIKKVILNTFKVTQAQIPTTGPYGCSTYYVKIFTFLDEM